MSMMKAAYDPLQRFRGMLNILRFNWPKYVLAAATIVASTAVWLTEPPPVVGGVLLAGTAAAFALAFTSLAVSHWIYDRSTIAGWRFLPSLFNREHKLASWTNIHSGFDDTTGHLRRLFPQATGTVIDLFDPALMTEASIHRARRACPPVGALAGKPESLPVATASQDVVFLLFAAHEIRSFDLQLALFSEIHRVLHVAGQVVLVEHMRDANNALVFGHGCLHFFSRRRWIALAASAGFRLRTDERITPFVRCFVLEKP